MTHSLVAHGGAACAAERAACRHSPVPACPEARHASSCSQSDAHAGLPTPGHAPLDRDEPTHTHPHDCAVCDELAVSNPLPSLIAPFTSVIEVLAIVHDREASQLCAPEAPGVCAARPPPLA